MQNRAIRLVRKLLVFEFLSRAAAEFSLTHSNRRGRANTNALATTDTILAVDPNEGRFVIEIRLQARLDIVVFIVEETRDLVDTIARSYFDTPVTMDTLVVIDLHLMLTPVATSRMHLQGF